MTKRVKDFESWTRQVERRIDRLERLPRGGGGGGSGNGVVGAFYNLPFVNGEAFARPPAGAEIAGYVVGAFTFTSGQEVGIASSMHNGIAYVRAPVSDGTYGTTLIYVML